MKRLIAWLCVAGAALFATGITFAGSPDSQVTSERLGIMNITITEADTLASLGIDTVIVDISRSMWHADSTAIVMHLPLRFTNQSTVGDSVTIDIDVSADGSRWDATEALNALGPINGGGTNMGGLGEWGRFMRVRILAADSTGLNSGYTILLSVPAVR